MNVIVVNGNPGDSAMTQDIQDHEELQPTFILEVTTDAVITLDQSHTVRSFNRGAEETFGSDASEVIGKPLDLLLQGWEPRIRHPAHHPIPVRPQCSPWRGRPPRNCGPPKGRDALSRGCHHRPA